MAIATERPDCLIRHPPGSNLMPVRHAAAGPSLPKTMEVDGVTLHLSTPDMSDQKWIGQEAILRQLLACWLVVDERDLPLAPRLTGPPGIGKTTLAMAGARVAKTAAFHQPVHGRYAVRRTWWSRRCWLRAGGSPITLPRS